MALKRSGCAGYREEMMLLGLLKRLHEPGVSDEEKRLIEEKASILASELGIESIDFR